MSLSQPEIPVTSSHLTVFIEVAYDALTVFQLFKNLLVFYGTSSYSVLKSDPPPIPILIQKSNSLHRRPALALVTLNCISRSLLAVNS